MRVASWRNSFGAKRLIATPPGQRQAFTLLELLLVMGLMVIIGGLSFPALKRPLANQRLTGGAKQVRVALARARLAALESGEPQAFRYVPGEARYRIGPAEWLPVVDASQAGDAESRPRLTASGNKIQKLATPQGAEATPQWEEFHLPETIVFTAPVAELGAEPTPAEIVPQAATDAAAAEGFDDAAWSAPIVFEADGSASDATLTVQNDLGLQVTVTLRGLTGVVSVGSIEQVEETLPGQPETVEASPREPSPAEPGATP